MMFDEILRNVFGSPYLKWPMGLMKIATTHGNQKFIVIHLLLFYSHFLFCSTTNVRRNFWLFLFHKTINDTLSSSLIDSNLSIK
jgi:hypothetical protein